MLRVLLCSLRHCRGIAGRSKSSSGASSITINYTGLGNNPKSPDPNPALVRKWFGLEVARIAVDELFRSGVNADGQIYLNRSCSRCNGYLELWVVGVIVLV